MTLKKIIASTAVIVFGLSAQGAFAEPFSGPYVGAEISHDHYNVKADNTVIAGTTVSANGLSGNGVSGGVYAGYDLSIGTPGFVGIEANFDYSGAKISASGTSGGNTFAASAKARESYGISGRAGAKINSNTGLYGLVGWERTRFKTEAFSNGTSVFADSRTKSAFVYGAGLQTYVSSHASIRVEYTISNYGSAGLNQDLGVNGIKVKNDKIAAGVSWHF